MPAVASRFPRRHVAHTLTGAFAAFLAVGTTRDAQAYAYGSGVCDAVADGGFMSPRMHHPGESGGFALRFDPPDYLPGERIAVTLAHDEGSEVFSGFLLYAEDAGAQRHGVFTSVPGTTLSGMLPAACAHFGHTITHLHGATVPATRASLALRWNAPSMDAGDLVFRALVLRADPASETGTDFYEVQAGLPHYESGIFRSRFESPP